MNRPTTARQKRAFLALLLANPQFAGKNPDDIMDELWSSEYSSSFMASLGVTRVKDSSLMLNDGCYYLRAKPAMS